MKKTFTAYAVAAIAGGAVLTTAGPALAASVDCTVAANIPNPVYIAGSSASQPYLQALAVALGTSVSIIYAKPASCNGLYDVTNTVAPLGETGTFYYLSPTGSAITCTGTGFGGSANPILVDVGVADVYPSSCITPQITLGATQKDFHGPIQPMEIVVPYASSENSISADAAYVVFGFDAASMYTVMPWNDPTAIWTRGDTSGTQVMIANAIGLSAAKWLSNTGDAGAAQIQSSSGNMASAVAAGGANKPNSTIGILSAGTADPLRGAAGTNDAGATTDGIKPLAFQATNQDCGYYPDSSLMGFDKINVRQGRYAIWGPLHFVAATDANGNATAAGTTNPVPSANANVAAVINAITHSGLTASSTPSLQTVVKAETTSHFVPDCAMQVSRTTEVGAEASYQPTNACGCYFESLTGGGTTLSSYCQTCTSDGDCADAGAYTHCNYGYCEAK
jgi:hypothetical protein